jgi:murein DD-endopeptidase MepM/ murein hydrolase activator NlpD
MTGHSAVFGKRREPHTVIIANGDSIRHFTIRPWMAALLGAALAAVALGYLVATSYLVFRDDLIGGSIARQARMQHAYEDRISALRAQVDRITSRQLLDQQVMETKVTELLQRQSALSERHGQLGPMLERLGAIEAPVGDGPQPAAAPDHRASLGDARPAVAQAGAFPFALWSTRKGEPTISSADRADMLFASINKSLRSIESDQIAKVTSLADDAYRTAETISEALAEAGLPRDPAFDGSDIGGPFVAIGEAETFEARVRELDEALGTLERTRQHALALPIANPAPGRGVSSTYGVRKDPLLGTPAMHSGMDFRAPAGFPARATAAGTVVKAGWNGGYGRMVEIEHGDGFTTRFAHLSSIGVSEGERVERGVVIGKVGSSGRSTGPHLHYEVRRDGKAVDPLRFLKAGKKLASYL